jgi:hypothetical protein
MAKKAFGSSSRRATTPVRSTKVRKSPVPRLARRTPISKPGLSITHEMIAQRAYFISISGFGGSQDENWLRAERELHAGLAKANIARV